jgi:hypothetical protein
MLMFYGSDLELFVDRVLRRGDGPDLCAAHDAGGQEWVILQVDDDPCHLVWLCAPVSARALDAVVADPKLAIDAIRHSLTNSIEKVVVENGRCVPDSCVLGGPISDDLKLIGRGPAGSIAETDKSDPTTNARAVPGPGTAVALVAA